MTLAELAGSLYYHISLRTNTNKDLNFCWDFKGIAGKKMRQKNVFYLLTVTIF